jgi:hypothetical protein
LLACYNISLRIDSAANQEPYGHKEGHGSLYTPYNKAQTAQQNHVHAMEHS